MRQVGVRLSDSVRFSPCAPQRIGIGVAQYVRDPLFARTSCSKQLFCQLLPQLQGDLTERSVFIGQLPLQRPRGHAQMRGDDLNRWDLPAKLPDQQLPDALRERVT